MNTNMAPVEQIEVKENMSLRKRERGGGLFYRGSGDADSTPNEGNKKNGNNKSDDSGKSGNGEQEDHDPPDSPLTSTFVAAKSTSVTHITSTAVTTIPMTIVVTSTTQARPSTWSISSSESILPVTSTSISVSFPTKISLVPSTTAFTSPADTSSQPRKGLNPDDPDSTATATKTKNKSTQSTTATAFAETVPVSSSSTLPTLEPDMHHDDHGLSPTGEHVLIAFGAIGAFILFIAAVYLIARMKNIDLFSKARGRKFGKGGARGWYGWRGKESDYSTDAPPKYRAYDGSFDYASEQKPIPAQRQMDAFFAQKSMPPMATPESAAALSMADTQRQDTVREALLDNSAPFGVSLAQPTTQSATQAFYSQNPSYDPSSTYGHTYNTNDAAGGLSRQTSDAYDPAQRDTNHMSYLSSLSSGFGDQIIIPEPGPTMPANAQASRQSYRQSRKFSWATSTRGPQGDRDTVYTDTSMDSATPRFRTINSWVAQQTGRVDRQNQSNDELSSMPTIPKPLQINTGTVHQRNTSEDPAFKHHPGDEIELSNGSRIPSTILDKRFGIN